MKRFLTLLFLLPALALAQKPSTTNKTLEADQTGHVKTINGHPPNLPAGSLVNDVLINAVSSVNGNVGAVTIEIAPLIVVQHPDGTSTSYPASSDTDEARGISLLSAVSAATAGDTIKPGSGTFAVAAPVSLPDNVSLAGAGMSETIIASSAAGESDGAGLVPGNNSVISDLTIHSTALSPSFSIPIGTNSTATAPIGQHGFTGAVLINLSIIGDTDGIFVYSGSSTLTAFNCVIATKWDTVFVAATGLIDLYGCVITATGPSSFTTQPARGPLAHDTSKVRMHGGRVTCSNGDTANVAFTAYTGAFVEAYNVVTDVSGTNPFDAQRVTTGRVSFANITRADGGALVTTGTAPVNLSRNLSRDNNLSELASASTARTNLGLGTAATTAATAYATAAQGTKADNVAAVNGLVKSDGAGTFSAATLTSTTAAINVGAGTDPSIPVAGDIWINSASSYMKYRTASGTTQTVAAADKANTFSALNTFNNGMFVSHTGENAQTGTTYTLILTDDGKLVTMTNASANTLTVPPNSSVAFPVGTRIFVEMHGAGVTTFEAGAGVTIQSRDGLLSVGGQYGVATLFKKATNTWLLAGDLQ